MKNREASSSFDGFVLHCDGCHKEYSDGERLWFRVGLTELTEGTVNTPAYDFRETSTLCPECAKPIKDWFYYARSQRFARAARGG